MTALYDFYRLYEAELALGTLALSLLLLLWLLVLSFRLSRLHRRYRAAMRGADGADLEGILARLRASQLDHAERLLAQEAHSQALAEQLAAHAGNVGIVRYNPFQDSGGDQSFSIAWIDGQASGVVLSSLYSRTGVRIYAKPLDHGESSYTLSDEERAAIRAARISD